eukprot:TRINITY_DN36856_c0_g1_i1.p1 TRINITY_DN36856_c0_g1~~TRINITY_DN36856_c0_g1_i1.p1  ORF type:complete len:415 (+),score=112.75 TRINITY_DN36856_c0_g1_i1:131-1246(+)
MAVVAMGGASDNLLKTLLDGDAKRVQRVLAWIQSVGTVMDFVWIPLSAALLDYYGRWPAIFAGQVGVLLLRFWVSKFPSVTSFCMYRLGQRLLLRLSMPATMAAYADLLGGRGSDKFARVTQRIDSILAIFRVLALYVGGRIKDDRTNFRVAAALNAMAATLLLGVNETLKPEYRLAINWRRAHPFSWIEFFSATPQLRKLAVAIALNQAAGANQTHSGFMRWHHDWDKRDYSAFLSAAESLQFPLQLGNVALNMFQGMDNYEVAQLDGRLGVVQVAASMLPYPFTLMSPVLEVFRHGGNAVSREVAVEAKRMGVGTASMGAAMSALGLPLQLILPPLYAELYATKEYLPSVASAALRVLNAEVALPWARG